MNAYDSLIGSLAEKAGKSILRDPEDYEVDEILYCGKCRTPKQKLIVDTGGRGLKVHVLCECATAKRNAEEQEKKDREFRERVERMREKAFSERLMMQWTFENDDLSRPKIRKAVKNYADNFDELRRTGRGLLLYGPVGTGKTYAASAVANALIDRGIPCLVTNFGTLGNRLQASFDGRQELLDSFRGYPLLVIDDLGAERSTEYMQEIVFSVIDARYRSGLPMIITTNMDIEEIKNPKSTAYARIYDRILERCFPVEVDGPSRRRAAVRASYEDMRSLLFG